MAFVTFDDLGVINGHFERPQIDGGFVDDDDPAFLKFLALRSAEASRFNILSKISDAELRQLRSIREYILGDQSALSRIKDIEDIISKLRSGL